MSFHENQRAEVNTSDVAYQLTSGGGKPGQGYPAVFQASDYGTGEVADTLVSGGRETQPHGSLDGKNLVMASGAANAEIAEDMSPTLHASHEQAIAFTAIPRRLTPIECERLQGFPDNWTAVGVKKQEREIKIPAEFREGAEAAADWVCQTCGEGNGEYWWPTCEWCGVDAPVSDQILREYLSDMADSPRYRMMGNAVTVNVAHWIGHRIMEVDKCKD